jgi:hypothetical protein
MGIGNGRRQHFTGRHITDPAEAARIMIREGCREENPAKQNNCFRNYKIPWILW